LLDGLRDGVALVADAARRQAHFQANGLSRDWAQSLRPVIERLASEP
jgi:hypothetical protein